PRATHLAHAGRRRIAHVQRQAPELRCLHRLPRPGAPLARFYRWLKAELELQGVALFTTDRARYSGVHNHEVADRIFCSVAFRIVVVTASGFLNPLVLEEIWFFAQKRNLLPILF
ncbi:hypothetical protein CFC21_110216, partial [Triticum aestivum]